MGRIAGGVSRYDGKEFTTYTREDGLGDNRVQSILEDREGHLWFGTEGGGVSRYDGKEFTTYTREDGLGDNRVQCILEDRKGNLWFGTQGEGVSRYDGKEFTTFTTEDGLAHDVVWTILEDQNGHLWFGTFGGGVSRYDGLVFQTMSRKDGLVHDRIKQILQDRHDDIWIATEGGLTRYRPRHTPPAIRLTNVIADRRYGFVQEIRLPVSQKFIILEFQGRSFTTHLDQLAYVYRLEGFDTEWQTTRAQYVEYQDLSTGTYTFQVRAVDRDLNYSEPIEVRLTLERDPRDERIDELEVRVRERTRELEETHRKLQEAQSQLIANLEGELQTAHDMQMGLMPKESPQIGGFDIAGRCIPANHVGGDFFQYFDQKGKLTLTLADVTGHAMEAAIPVVMFSGILRSEMRHGGTIENLFRNLNQTLHETLDHRTFICFEMGELNPSTRTFRLANGGCPYTYHFRAARGDIAELQIDTYPLGIRPDTEYHVLETQLQAGDRVVFCSDGIIEADNEDGEQFGFDRTAETFRKACLDNLSAEATIDRILKVVADFKGDAPQSDDMTCMVVRVE